MSDTIEPSLLLNERGPRSVNRAGYNEWIMFSLNNARICCLSFLSADINQIMQITLNSYRKINKPICSRNYYWFNSLPVRSLNNFSCNVLAIFRKTRSKKVKCDIISNFLH